jgi:hypothetical protein
VRINDLLTLVEAKAIRISDGHLTLMRFSTGWKAMLQTPVIDVELGRPELDAKRSYETAREALLALLDEAQP